MRWMPTNIQQLPQSSEDSCLHRVDCSPLGTGTCPGLPPCPSGMYLLWGHPIMSQNHFHEASDQAGTTPVSGLLAPWLLVSDTCTKHTSTKETCNMHSDFALPFPQHICWTHYPLHAFAHAICPAWDAHFSFQGLSQSRDIAIGFLRVRVLS